jgi:hypothetical protein
LAIERRLGNPFVRILWGSEDAKAVARAVSTTTFFLQAFQVSSRNWIQSIPRSSGAKMKVQLSSASLNQKIFNVCLDFFPHIHSADLSFRTVKAIFQWIVLPLIPVLQHF